MDVFSSWYLGTSQTVLSNATGGRFSCRVFHLVIRSHGGAVEDYRINITNTPPACPNPSNLSVTTAGANDASLTWDGAANYYIVEYDPSGFTRVREIPFG